METILMLAALTVPRIDPGHAPAIELVDEMFESGGFELHPIDRVNWPEQFPDRPEVGFRIAHSGSEIYIKYYVTEQVVRATFDEDGGRPYQDSCVEFFVQPRLPEDATCYNLEMNCIGYGLFHARRPGESSVKVEGLDRIRRLPSLPREAFGTRQGRQSWTLTLAIPVEVFSLTDVSGRTMRANFYKCGDELPRPHYLSWSPIDTPKPSFHQPDFFGRLKFE